MSLPNIHLNKGKYPQSGEVLLNVSAYDISHISQVYADKPQRSDFHEFIYKFM